MHFSVLSVWSAVTSDRKMIAFSPISTFQVRLPMGKDPKFSLRLVILIRDTRDCIKEWNRTSIIVRPDLAALNDLINQFQDPSKGLMNDPFTQLFNTGHPNTVGQVITISVSQQFNQMNTQNIDKAISSSSPFISFVRKDRCFCLDGIPAAIISVSPLGAPRSSPAVVCISVRKQWDRFFFVRWSRLRFRSINLQ